MDSRLTPNLDKSSPYFALFQKAKDFYQSHPVSSRRTLEYVVQFRNLEGKSGYAKLMGNNGGIDSFFNDGLHDPTISTITFTQNGKNLVTFSI